MVGTADALDETLDVLGGTDLDHQIDIAPVDAEIERAGADDRAQLSSDHGSLDTVALFAGERAVVDADRQPLVVLQPEVVEEDLGLRAGVVEDERGAMALDLVEDRGDRVASAPACPGRREIGFQNRNVGFGARIGKQHGAGVGMAGKKPRERGRILDRGREADAPQARREGLQPCKAQHQLIAAL